MNPTLRVIILALAVLASFGVSAISGFVVTPLPLTKGSLVQQREHTYGIISQDDSSRVVSCSAFVDSSSIMISESWRQYVPLIVSVGIIVDILLGNPLANTILKPMRPEEEVDKSEKKNDKPKSKARIDAELVAKQALDKANNTLELRRFLDESKTDYDRMEEMKRKLDAKMQDLDEDLAARQSEIDNRKT